MRNAIVCANRDIRRAEPRLAVLIPCCNEELTVAQVVADFRTALPSAQIHVFDNNSTDRTVLKARAAGAHVASEPRQGKGYVVQSMFRSVDADIYVLVDGDGTYPAEAVQALVDPIIRGEADMVIGSRLHRGAVSQFSSWRRYGNRAFVLVLRLLFAIRLTDLLSGYRVLTRGLAQHVRLRGGGFEIEPELTIKAIRAGFRVIERPVNLGRRPPGSRSKLRPCRDGLAILGVMLALRRQYEARRQLSPHLDGADPCPPASGASGDDVPGR